MKSGNLQVKRSPERIPRTLGNFLAGLSGKVLVLSALMVVWSLAGQSDLMAQCGIDPDPGDSESVTFTLSPGASCVVINNTALAGTINPDGGCDLYFTDDPSPSDGDALDISVTVCCDGSGDFDPGETIYVFSDDDGTFDGASSVGPVFLTVFLNDNTSPTIDDSGTETPNDGDMFALDSDNTYTYTGDALSAPTPDGMDNCFATLNWSNPDFSDNCLMDSLFITFTAGAGNVPDDFPADITIVGNAMIAAASGDPESGEFWANSTDGAATTVVTYRLVDEQGNETTYSFEVTVTDNVDPEISCPVDQTVSTDPGVCTYTVPDNAWDASAIDNCGVVSLTHDQGTPDSTLQGIVFDGDVGGQTTTVTWTAVDAEGNTVDCSFDVTVEDNEAPVISCPPGQGFANFAGPFDVSNWTFDDGGGDGTVDISNAPESITITSNDDGQDSIFTTFCITIPSSVDSVLFEFDYETFDIDGPSYDPAGYIVNGTDFQLTDDGGPDVQSGSETVTLIPGDNFCFYAMATDGTLGRSEMTISNLATQAFGGFFYNTVDLCGYEVVGDTLDATAVDNCDPDPVLTHDYAMAPDPNTLEDAFFPVGETTVVWTATDADMNASTCEMTVVVEDNEPPVIGDCPSDITVTTGLTACQEQASWIPPSDLSDNCALESFEVVAIGSDGDSMSITNTHPGNCVNSLNFTGIFSPGLWSTTQSTGDADFTHTTNQLSVELGSSVPQETDVVTTTVLAPSDFNGVVSMRIEQISPGLTVVSGGSTVTVSVDGNEVFSNTNNASGVEFITFNFEEGDELEIEIAVANGILAGGFATVNIDNMSFICDNTQSNALVSLGESVVSYYLTDIHGNVDTCEFTITLEDNVAPVANAQDVTVSVSAGNSPVNVPASDFDVASTDNCAIDTMYLSWNPTGTYITVDCSNVGDTIDIDFIVCDAANNCDTAQVQLFVVEDAIPVTAFCPADQVVDTDPGVCEAVVSYPTPRVHDGCSADSAMVFQSGFESGEAFPEGVTPVTWYHVGKNTGDTVYCQFNVVVQDNEDPVVVDCPSDINTVADPGECSATVSWTEPTATDNCTDSADIEVIQNKFPGDQYPVGTTTVQYTFMDDAGNSSQCVFQIFVDDAEPPIVGCQPFARDLDECGEALVHFTDILNFIQDDCGIETYELIYNSDTFLNEVTLLCADIGTNNISLLVTDAAGNTAQCNTTVTVTDTIGPEVACYADFSVNISDYDPAICTVTDIIEDTDFAYANCSELPLDPGQYYTNDTCGVVSNYTITDEDGNVISGGPFNGPVTFDPGLGTFQLGENTVTVIVTDANDLADTCSFIITVIDDVDPIVNCPSDITVENDPGECGAIVEFEAGADDNCSIDTTFYSQDPGTFFPVGTTTVIFTAIDGSGNESTCTFDVTVNDTEDPVFTFCPEDVIVTTSEDGSIGDCLFVQSGDAWDADAIDNCEILSITHDFAIDTNTTNPGALSDTTLAGSRFAGPCDETTVTWYAEDIHGNVDSCSFTVFVRDDEEPSFVDSLELTNTGEGCGDTVRLVNLTNVCHAELLWHRPTLDDTYDNCWISDSLTLEEHIDDPSVASAVNQNFPFGDGSTASSPEVDFPVGVTTITYTLSDRECLDFPANDTTCVLTVIVEDTQAPTITCPSPQNIYSICADTEIPNYIGSSSVQDNCATYDVTQDPTPGTTLGDIGVALEDEATFQVTLTVTQQSYNEDFDVYSVDCDFTVTLVDEDQWTPTAGVPQGFLPTLELISCGGGSVVINAPTATKPDPTDCDSIMTTNGMLTSSNSNFVDLGNGEYQLEIGTYNISWVYNGGPLNQFQEINVIADPIPPVAECEDIVVQLDDNGQASIDAEDVDGGSTDNCGIASYEVDIDEFSCADLAGSPIEVTLTVTDLDGNTAECTADVTVEDNIAPVAECEDEITVHLDDTGNGSITVADVDAGSSDNCGIEDSALSQSEFDCGDLGDNSVTLTVTDQSGNTDACQTNVNVVDDIAPVAVCQDVTIELSASGTAVIGEGGDPLIGCSSGTQFPSFGAPFDVDGGWSNSGAWAGEYTRIFSSGGGTFEFSSSVPTDFISVQLESSGDFVAVGTTPVVANLNAGEIYRFYRHTNSDCGSQSTNRTVAVSPAAAPPPSGEPNEYDISILDGGTTDNCDEFEIGISQSEYSCIHVGDNNVTVTFTDPSGNSSQCISVVTVEDNTAPDFTCPADIVTCIGEQLIVAGPASDACGIGSGVYEATGATTFSGAGYEIDEKFNPGVTTVTYTITDNNDNVTECSFTVDVTDDIPPVPVCVDKVNVPLGPDGEVTLPASIVDLGSFDLGCDPAEPLTFLFDINEADNPVSEFTFGCEHIGDNDVELYVMDAAWNTASCLTTITIQDNTDPVAVCTEDVIEIFVNNASVTVSAEDIDAGSFDNSEPCYDITLEAQNNVFTLDDVGTQTVVLLVSDEFNNYSTCEATVNVLSGVPTAVCVVDPISVNLDADGMASITPADVDGGSFDPEGETLTLSVDPSMFDCSDAGMDVVVTLTVTDPHGNSDECQAVVSVNDNLVPVAICQDVTVELDNNGVGSISADDVDNGSFDNCGLGSLDLEVSQFDCGDVGDNNVVLTVTDNNGNETTCEAVVTVEDNISPTFVCDDELTLVLNNQGEGSIVPADVLETSVSDNCGIDTMILSQSDFTCEDLGFNSASLTVYDVNGNSETCEFVLYVSASTGTCPEIALISEDIEGAEGDIVCVPITVENFSDITGVQFSVEFDSDVAVVLGIQESGLTNVSSNVIGNTATVSWFVSLDSAKTLADGSEILCIEVELVGEEGDMTGAIITDDPVDIEVTQGLQVVPISVFSGTVTIDSPASMADVSGSIETEYDFGVANADVNVTGDVNTTLVTDANGNYDISVLLGSDITLTPYKNDNHGQGVSTMDLILIQRHLLLIQELDSPYKLIAADVSNDGVISTFDLVILQALIIGNITEYPNNTSWRFIDADFTFSDPTNPFADTWPEYISLTDVGSDEVDNDFVAIKIGDVNESVGLDAPQTRGVFNFILDEKSYSAGDIVEVSFNANNFVNMTGYQFTLDYDAYNLEFTGFENPGNVDNLSDANVNAYENGRINLNWYNANANSLAEGTEVFKLTFRATSDIDAISEHVDISRTGLRAEAYTAYDDVFGVDVEFIKTGATGDEFVLYQNIPNPFSGSTIIGFELPQSTSATIEIIDETGKLIRSATQDFDRGYNEIRVDISELSGSGVYFYRVTTAEHSAVKSMILVD